MDGRIAPEPGRGGPDRQAPERCPALGQRGVGSRQDPLKRGKEPLDKLLLVDDDAQMRNVLALYLRRAGFTVLDAATLAEARRLQAKQAPDLTIVDYQLPDGTAFDLLTSARERDGSEAVIVLTGLGTIDLAVRAIKSGAEHFLTKPVDLESLEVLVRRTLDLQRERRQRAVAAVVGSETPDPFLGDSAAIKSLKELAGAAIESDV